MKIMDKLVINANQGAEQVREEICVMKKMRHPNVVNFEEVLASETKLYIVMEELTGGDLYRLLKKGPVGEERAKRYFIQMIEAVSFCHSLNIVHRDLKPENILLDDKDNIKVTDFGFSKTKQADIDKELLHTSCGTPEYCPPEIMRRSGEGYSGVKVDAWSCGIILYTMLVGNLPFHGDDNDTNALYNAIVKCEYEWPQHLNISTLAKDLVRRILVPDASRRLDINGIKRHSWFPSGSFSDEDIEEALAGSSSNPTAQGRNPGDQIPSFISSRDPTLTPGVNRAPLGTIRIDETDDFDSVSSIVYPELENVLKQQAKRTRAQQGLRQPFFNDAASVSSAGGSHASSRRRPRHYREESEVASGSSQDVNAYRRSMRNNADLDQLEEGVMPWHDQAVYGRRFNTDLGAGRQHSGVPSVQGRVMPGYDYTGAYNSNSSRQTGSFTDPVSEISLDLPMHRNKFDPAILERVSPVEQQQHRIGGEDAGSSLDDLPSLRSKLRAISPVTSEDAADDQDFRAEAQLMWQFLSTFKAAEQNRNPATKHDAHARYEAVINSAYKNGPDGFARVLQCFLNTYGRIGFDRSRASRTVSMDHGSRLHEQSRYINKLPVSNSVDHTPQNIAQERTLSIDELEQSFPDRRITDLSGEDTDAEKIRLARASTCRQMSDVLNQYMTEISFQSVQGGANGQFIENLRQLRSRIVNQEDEEGVRADSTLVEDLDKVIQETQGAEKTDDVVVEERRGPRRRERAGSVRVHARPEDFCSPHEDDSRKLSTRARLTSTMVAHTTHRREDSRSVKARALNVLSKLRKKNRRKGEKTVTTFTTRLSVNEVAHELEIILRKLFGNFEVMEDDGRKKFKSYVEIERQSHRLPLIIELSSNAGRTLVNLRRSSKDGDRTDSATFFKVYERVHKEFLDNTEPRRHSRPSRRDGRHRYTR